MGLGDAMSGWIHEPFSGEGEGDRGCTTAMMYIRSRLSNHEFDVTLWSKRPNPRALELIESGYLATVGWQISEQHVSDSKRMQKTNHLWMERTPTCCETQVDISDKAAAEMYDVHISHRRSCIGDSSPSASC